MKEIIAACIPNGMLQARYNPSPEDSIWRAGRHTPPAAKSSASASTSPSSKPRPPGE